MRLACVNQDPGIAPERAKGAAVHLLAMRQAFRSIGVEALPFDEPADERLAAALAQAHACAPLDGVYERYALGRAIGSRFARANGLPHVLEVNAPLADEERRWRGARTDRGASEDRETFSAASLVLAVSSLVADYAGARGARAGALEIVPNGVDTERFRPRRADDALRARLVPAGRVALGFHGRLRPWHGFATLVETAARLLAEGAPIHMVLAGEGAFEEALGSRVDAAHVTRIPWVPHDEVAPIVASFDVLPLTYSPDHPCYFSPLKLAEALAAAVVPVVPRLGDLPAIVRADENGLVYEPGDPQALLDGVRRLVRDPELRARLAGRARASAEHMSWRRTASLVAEVVAAGRLAIAEGRS